MQKYILIVVSVLCPIIHAATLTEKGITWTYSVENGVAELGLGLMSTAIPVDTTGDIEIPEKLGGFPVKSLGKFCFRKCSSITSVLIPPGVTNISQAAFDQCSLLRSVSIPEGVLEIGYGAFLYCWNLESLTIPTSVKNIGQNAFSYCDKLGNGVVIVDKCVLTVNGTCPQNVDLPFGTRLIADYAFDGCSNMVSISLPRTIESIGEGAFWECSGLKAVVVPDLVQTLRSKTFGYCGAMVEMQLPSSLQDIGSFCFSGCSSLKGVVIPAALTNIGYCAFRSCIALDTMVFNGRPPAGLTATHKDFDIGLIRDSMPIYYNAMYSDEWQAVIQECGFTNAKPKQEDGGPYIESVDGIEWTFGVDESMFGGASIGWVFYPQAIPQDTNGDIVVPALLGGWKVCHIWADAFGGCSQLTSISIPESVTSISSCAFDGCSGLVSMTIPSKVTTIESSTFRGCSGLASISVPSNVTSIGECAFENCYNLKIVDIPSSVSEIGSEAFRNCCKLESITIPSKVTGIAAWTFSGCASLKSLTVPTNVIYIGEYAFENCASLMSVTFEGAPPCGVTLAAIKTDAAIRYNVAYESEWLSVIQQCGWTNATSYRPFPIVSGDPGAVVTYGSDNGYVIKPSAEIVDVEVMLPAGVEPEKVTVVLGADVETVKPNGANVKIVKGENDITDYLNVPKADASGTFDLTKAVVKEEFVKEALDPDKGAEIVLNAESPSLTTSETKPGLTYTLHEGATLKGMSPGDSKVGDGQPWTPNISVKGGTSGFYSIGVTK